MIKNIRVFTTKPNKLFNRFGNKLEKLQPSEKIAVQAKLCIWSMVAEMAGNYNALFKNLNCDYDEHCDNINEILTLAEGMNLTEVSELIDSLNVSNRFLDEAEESEIPYAA
jgi:hypothetical protein